MEKFMKGLFKSDSDSKFKGKANVCGTKADQEASQKQKQTQDGQSTSGASSSSYAAAAQGAASATASISSPRTGPAFTGQGRRLGDSSSNPPPPAKPKPNPQTASSSTKVEPSRPGPQQNAHTLSNAALTASRFKAESLTGREDTDNIQRALTLTYKSPEGQTSLPVMATLVRNIVGAPAEAKYHRVRMSNPKIRKAVGEVPGGVEFLQAAGFELAVEPSPSNDGSSEEWAVLPQPPEQSSALANRLKAALALIEAYLPPTAASAAPKPAAGPVQRNPMVLLPADRCEAARMILPDSYFQRSLGDLKADSAAARQRLEQASQLTTKAHKEKLAAANRKHYTSTTIRIRLPDGFILQGCFGPRDTVVALMEWVAGCLRVPLPFQLFPAGAREPIDHVAAPPTPRQGAAPAAPPAPAPPLTLLAASLVPTALLNLKWASPEDRLEVCLKDEMLRDVWPLDQVPMA